MNFGLVKTFDHLPRVELMPGFKHVRYQKDMSKICDSATIALHAIQYYDIYVGDT
jgi:hypothetical protein